MSALILIVDDDSGARYVKSHVLERHGYSVIEASSGREALELTAERSPALILLDVKLPDGSGLDVCRQIKERFSHCMVLQTSAAFTDVSDRTDALEGGADSYLVEPTEPAELIAIVRALLRIRAAEEDLRRVNGKLESLIADRTRELKDANRKLADEAADRRKAETALWHAQKLDLISRFSAGIAHDFNNLLTIISGNLQLIGSTLDGPSPNATPKLRRMASVAESAAEKGGQIIARLLAFARRSSVAPESARLSEMIASWEELLKRALGEFFTLEIVCQPDPWTCVVDLSQLEATLVNLVLNAKDAMPDGGVVRISVGNAEIDDAQAVVKGLPPGQYVLLTVADMGTGMSPSIMEHIFEPFFTTKAVGRGSGLGLSQVYGFVQQSSGHILVDTAEGKGSVFNLYFPRNIESTTARRFADHQADGKLGGSERVLIVDDNDEVREVTHQLVSSFGYEVLSVASGMEAMKVMEDRNGVDLVITDVVMPGEVDGLELAKRLRARAPNLPVLLVTGYSSRVTEGRSELPLLQKPFRSGELARHIRAALDQRPAGAALS